MKRHIPGLHGEQHERDDTLEGIFLVRVDRVFYRWHPQRTFCDLSFSNRENIKAVRSTVASTALPKRCGNFAGSCGTLATIPI